MKNPGTVHIKASKQRFGITSKRGYSANTAMAGAVTGGLERLDDRCPGRCDRAVSESVGQLASGAAERTDVAVQNWTYDESMLILEGVRLVNAAWLAVGTAQRTRLLCTNSRARWNSCPLPWRRRWLLLLLLL